METVVTQTLRPIRLMFIIPPNDKRAFLAALKVCSALWGGIYFPILPLYKRFTKRFREEYFCVDPPLKFYKNAIRNFDPDFIVTKDGFESDFIDQVRGDRRVLNIMELEKGIADKNARFGIGFDDLLGTLLVNEFKYVRADAKKILLPIIADIDLFCSVVLGNIGTDHVQSIDTPAENVVKQRISISNLSTYFNDTFLPPITICSYRLRSFERPFGSGSQALYIFDHTRVEDLIKFWNLRALGWEVLAIPVTLFHEQLFQRIIDEQLRPFLADGLGYAGITVLNGYAIPANDIELIQQKLRDKAAPRGDEMRSIYSFQWWYPRFWEDGHNLAYDRAASTNLISEQKFDLLHQSSGKVDVTAINCPFTPKRRGHADPIYKIQISQSYSDYEGKYAEVLPALSFADLEIITKGSGFNQWRFSEKGTFYLALGDEIMISTYFPEAFRVFEAYFERRGLTINFSSVGKLGLRLLQNIGGILGVNSFMAAEVLEIFKLFENGTLVHKDQLFGSVTRYKDPLNIEQPKEFVKSLLFKRLIEFGCEIQCAICNQRSFYTLSNVKGTLVCPICRNSFYFPSHDPDSVRWAYMGIGSFSRNNSADGLLCVFLLLRFFRVALASLDGGITPILSFEIKKEGRVEHEADLALFYKERKSGLDSPDLIFCECKTVRSFEKIDIDRMQRLAYAFPGCILTFATLKEQLSEKERNLIARLALSFRRGSGLSDRPVSPVIVLTRSELTERFGWTVFENLNLDVARRFKDQIGSLADVTCVRYLGIESYETVTSRRFHQLMGRNRKKPNTKTA